MKIVEEIYCLILVITMRHCSGVCCAKVLERTMLTNETNKLHKNRANTFNGLTREILTQYHIIFMAADKLVTGDRNWSNGSHYCTLRCLLSCNLGSVPQDEVNDEPPPRSTYSIFHIS